MKKKKANQTPRYKKYNFSNEKYAGGDYGQIRYCRRKD